jgi:hypothetical protein
MLLTVCREEILRTVDDAEVLCTPALHARLGDSTSAFCDEVERLDDRIESSGDLSRKRSKSLCSGFLRSA